MTAGEFCGEPFLNQRRHSHPFQALSHCQRRCSHDSRRGVGSKQHGPKDARPHDAIAPGEEHRSGSFRICAGSSQAHRQVQIAISIQIYAESQNHDYDWYAHALRRATGCLARPTDTPTKKNVASCAPWYSYRTNAMNISFLIASSPSARVTARLSQRPNLVVPEARALRKPQDAF